MSGRVIRIATIKSELRPEIVLELISLYEALPSSLQSLPVLIDFTQIESVTLQKRNVYRIISLLQEKGPDVYPRIVAIASCDVLFGMIRMLQTLWGTPSFHVVRTEQEAMTIISQP